MKMLLIHAVILIVVAVVGTARSQFYSNGSSLNLIKTPFEKSRGPVRYQYSINLFTKLNSNLTLSTFSNTGPVHWKLIKYNEESIFDGGQDGQKSIFLPIYDVTNPLVRNNQLMRKEFVCKPSERECSQLIIPAFSFKNLGTYSYQSLINTVDTLTVNYNISIFLKSIQANCTNTSQSTVQAPCAYNQASQTMSIIANQKVKLTCSILIAQNSIFEPAVDLSINLCSSTNTNTTREIIPFLSLNTTYSNLNITTSIVLYNLTSTCIREFTKADKSKTLECNLVPKIDYSLIPVELVQATQSYDKLNINLEFEYGPEIEQTANQNKTLIVGINDNLPVNFSCPFVARPDPVFYWRVAYVSYDEPIRQPPFNFSPSSNVSVNARLITRQKLTQTDFVRHGKVYSLPHNLEVGSYIFECIAEKAGTINKVSDTVRFQLNIIRIEELWSKKEDLDNQIKVQEEEVSRLQTQITDLNEQLVRVNEKLTKNKWARNEFDKVIKETQAAYLKIFESSQKLLNLKK